MNKLKSVLGTLLLAAMVIFLVVVGVSPLFAKANPVTLAEAGGAKKGTYVDGTTYFSSDEFYTITHLISVIPAGFDHYFLVSDEELESCIVIRADKKWAEQFDYDGINEDGVRVNGVLKEMDYDLKKEIPGITQEIGVGIATYYVDTLSDRYAILTIVCVVVFILIGVGFLLMLRNGAGGSPLAKVIVFLFMANLIFALHILVMLF